MAGFTLVSNQTIIARNAGALYGIEVGNANMTSYVSQVGSNVDGFLNTVYTNSVGTTSTSTVADVLITNLGITGDSTDPTSAAGQAKAYIVSQLNAVAYTARGAVVNSILSAFSNLATDPTFGSFATAWNTQVANAVAYAATAGTGDSTWASVSNTAVGQTFTLLAGADTFTGGTGNDTFNATGDTFSAKDSLTGGAGVDTLNVVDTTSASKAGIPSGVTMSGVEKMVVSSNASLGVAAVSAASATTTLVAPTSTPGVGDSVVVTVGGIDVSYTVNGTATTDGSSLRTAIISALNALGYTTAATATASAIGVSATGSATVTLTGTTDGAALPTVTVKSATLAAELPSVAKVAGTVAVAAVTYDVSSYTDMTDFTGTSVGGARITAAATTNVSETSTGTGAVVSTGGLTQTLKAADSVQASSGKGAIAVTTTVPTSSLAAVSNTGWSAGAGVFVRGGTAVSITETAGTSTAGANPGGNATAVQVGAQPSSASGTAGANSGAFLSATSTGYPEVIGNLSSAPTGNVTVSTKTAFTDTSGYSNVFYGTGAATVYMNGGDTATITGAGTVNITDVQTILLKSSSTATAAAGTSKLANVNLTGVSGATGVTTDAIQNLSIVDSATTVTINSNTGANSGALNVTVGNSTATVVDANATSIAVTGTASSYQKVGGTSGTLVASGSPSSLTLTAAKATSVSFAGTSDVTLAASTLSVATAITDTSAGKVALGDLTAYSKLTSVDASAATGDLSATVGSTGNYGMNLKGGSGNDTVTLKASASLASALVNGVTVSTSIDLGAGNDKLLDGGSASVGVGTVIDAGAGTDTVAATLVNAGNGGLFKNFEIIDVVGAAASGSLDASLLTNSTITGVAVSNNITSAGAFTVSNIAGTNLTVNVTDTGTTAGSLTATLASSAGTADTAAITYGATSSGATTSILTLFKTTGIESVSVASGGTLAAVGDSISNTLTGFEDTSNKTATITITGDKAFTLGAYTDTSTYTTGVTQSATVAVAPTANQVGALKTIDGSAATGALTIVAGASTVINSGSYNNVYDGLVITGGAAADTLVNTATAGVVNGGAGADTIVVTGAGAVVDGGAGGDTIVVGAAVSTTLTGGAGNDNFVLTSATASSLSSIKLTTITDLAVGDKLTFTIGGTNVFNSTKADVTAATSLANAYDVAVTAAGNTNNQISWFQYAGNTYVVNHTGSTTDLATTDNVVKITGLVDLSTASFTEGGAAASYLTIA